MDPIAFHGNSARCRLLAALARGGPSEDFWRKFFASLDDLGPEDLRAVVLAAGDVRVSLSRWLGGTPPAAPAHAPAHADVPATTRGARSGRGGAPTLQAALAGI